MRKILFALMMVLAVWDCQSDHLAAQGGAGGGLAFISLFTPAQAAEPPREVIVTFYDTLLSVMKRGAALGFKGRVDALTPAVDTAFDMSDMARLTLGASAKTLSADQFARFTEAFRRYTIANYAANFDSYEGQRFEVGEPRPGFDGSAVVPSKLVPGDGSAPVELDYVMRDVGGHWGITDVLAEGSVSQVAMRRSEFVSVLRREGFDGLLRTIDSKTRALAVPKG